MKKFSLAVPVLFALAACSGDQSSPATANGGTLVISVGGDPETLLPSVATDIPSKVIDDLVYDHLAEVGDSLNTVGDAGFQPRLAKTWDWAADSMSIAFHIDPAAKWHDGKPVTANDVVFSYHLYADSANASPFASGLKNIDSLTARDSATAVVWFADRSPMQFYDAVNTMSIMPAHAFGDAGGKALLTTGIARAPIGSGRFRFVKWNAGQSIELVADTSNYRGRPSLDRMIMTISPDFNGALTRLVGGEADMLEQIPPASLPDVAKDTALNITFTPGLDYNFIQMNLNRPVFRNRVVRRALTMALDRPAIVRNAYDSLASVAIGPTVRAYPTTDTSLTQIPFDFDGASKTLDAAGWKDTNGDGVRDRAGAKLEFTLIVPASSKSRNTMAVAVQEQLRKLGVKMNIEPADFAAFIDRETKRDFDAVFGGWHVEASPGGIRDTWMSKGGTNYGSYSNAQFDSEVDSALASMTLGDRRAHFKSAYQTIIDDAPAIWFAEPKRIMAIHKRIKTKGVRPDAWWANIPEWSIPANERIARDRAAPSK